MFLDSHLNIPYGATIVVFTNIKDIFIILCGYGEEEIVYYACLQVERIWKMLFKLKKMSPAIHNFVDELF